MASYSSRNEMGVREKLALPHMNTTYAAIGGLPPVPPPYYLISTLS